MGLILLFTSFNSSTLRLVIMCLSTYDHSATPKQSTLYFYFLNQVRMKLLPLKMAFLNPADCAY